MNRLLDRLDVPAPLLWIDADDYCERLLANGRAPWTDAAAWLAWQRKGQGLLRSDVVALPVARVIDAWLAAQPTVRSTMGLKNRLLLPLRTLLANEALRVHLVEMIGGLRSSQASTPVVLVLPSPRAWVAIAYRQAFADEPEPEVGADDADSAAVYIADFLRAFGEAGLDGVLLVESAETVPGSDDDLSCYGAVFNLAAHYRWACGIELPKTGDFDASALDFVISDEPQTGARRHGHRIAWQSETARAVHFSFITVPADGEPEQVLERLRRLRESA